MTASWSHGPASRAQPETSVASISLWCYGWADFSALFQRVAQSLRVVGGERVFPVLSQYMIWTLYSSQSVNNADLEALLAPFGAERDEDGWVIPLLGGRLVVLEGTEDIGIIPQRLRDQAAEVLGAEPVYITVMSSEVKTSGKPIRNVNAHLRDERKLAAKASELVQRIGSAFGARWPAVLSDDAATSMTPLGSL